MSAVSSGPRQFCLVSTGECSVRASATVPLWMVRWVEAVVDGGGTRPKSRDRAARGDQLRPAAFRCRLSRRDRPLSRRGGCARSGAEGVVMTRIVVTGYASLDYVARLD